MHNVHDPGPALLNGAHTTDKGAAINPDNPTTGAADYEETFHVAGLPVDAQLVGQGLFPPKSSYVLPLILRHDQTPYVTTKWNRRASCLRRGYLA